MANKREGPEPVISRSLLIPYNVNRRFREYAAYKGISITSAIVEAMRRYIREVIDKEMPREEDHVRS